MARHHETHVVAERVAGDLHWGVSYTTSTDFVGCDLHVTLFRSGCQIVGHGDHHNRRFATSEEAHRFAAEHGYTRRYFTSPDLRARRIAKSDQLRDEALAYKAARHG